MLRRSCQPADGCAAWGFPALRPSPRLGPVLELFRRPILEDAWLSLDKKAALARSGFSDLEKGGTPLANVTSARASM